MKQTVIVLIFFLLISDSAILYGAEAENDYTSPDKFTRSIINILTFYFELPIAMYETSVEENPIMGLLYGLPVGVARSGFRLCAGLVELGTFPFPPYEPMLEPEYIIFPKRKTD